MYWKGLSTDTLLVYALYRKSLKLTCQVDGSDVGMLPEFTQIGVEAVSHSGISRSPGFVLCGMSLLICPLKLYLK